jgi:hypothetical protein
MSQVAAVNTPASASEVYGAILATGISTNAARLALAQSALETGGWGRGLWGWNLGNITTAGSTFQVLPGNGLHFKAYGSLQEGANDFINYLASHGLIAIGDTGDLSAYVARLKAINYAGNADYAAYQSGMQSWLSKLQNVAPAPVLLAGVFGGSPLTWLGAAGILGGAWWVATHIRGRSLLR